METIVAILNSPDINDVLLGEQLFRNLEYDDKLAVLELLRFNSGFRHWFNYYGGLVRYMAPKTIYLHTINVVPGVINSIIETTE